MHRAPDIFEKPAKLEILSPGFHGSPRPGGNCGPGWRPNLASPDPLLYKRSFASLEKETERAQILGAEYIVLHTGKSKGDSPERASGRLARALNRIAKNLSFPGIILLENTAGQGSEIGSSFEELAYILSLTEEGDKIGICLDTAHLFERGYDIRDKKGVDGTIGLFDKLAGLRCLRLIHLNDSKTPLGSRTDRHEHIGKGFIGGAGFKALLNHPALNSLPFIMETPKDDPDSDRKNMERVKKLLL